MMVEKRGVKVSFQLEMRNRALSEAQTAVDVTVSRWTGTLDTRQMEYCHRHGIALAYDPAQAGWIAMDCPDAFDDAVPTDAMAAKPERVSLQLPPLRIRCIELERRYTLRPWAEEDLSTFVALLDNPKIWRHLPEDYPAPLSEDLAREMIALSNVRSHHDVRAVVVDGRIAGQVRVLHGRPDASEAEISYWLGEDCWGKGYGKDAVMLQCYQYFRNHPDVRSLFARIHKDNAASKSMIEKAHFAFESIDPIDEDWTIHRIGRSMFWQT